jgi:hypothetical protein
MRIPGKERIFGVPLSDGAAMAEIGASIAARRSQAKLRQLAFQRLDHEVFAQIELSPAPLRFGAEDLPVLASFLRSARGHLKALVPDGPAPMWNAEADALTEFVAAVLENSELPSKPSNAPPFREYFLAVIEWYVALYRMRRAKRFEPTVIAFSRFDMSAMPDLRERFAVELADIGRRMPLPVELDRFVQELGMRPYLLSSAGALRLLGFALHRGLADAPQFEFAREWLSYWLHHLGRSSFRANRQAMLQLRDDTHTRLGMRMRVRSILRGRFGAPRTAFLLLLIKADHRLFIKPNLSRRRIGLFWFACIRFFARRLTRLARTDPNRALPARPSPRRDGRLAILDGPRVAGSRHDIIVTRAQGGFGDILTMRPGLIEAARRMRQGRVVFATSRDFFPVFSIDDPVALVDINAADIDLRSFGRWANLTDCPAARVEAAELPRIRSNRIDIFARAMGARFRRWSRRRVYPIAFDETAARAAKALVDARAPDGPRIGIQLRSAESYKDVPAMLAAARTLAARYSVFVFDNRPIPRQDGDRFIAVDNQPIRTVLAMLPHIDALLTPDSSFMHVAGSCNIPCLALFGSADGRVRCRPYPSVRYLDARQSLACIPCWRNEVEKCRLGDGYTSVCLGFLTAPVIVSAMEELLSATLRTRHSG